MPDAKSIPPGSIPAGSIPDDRREFLQGLAKGLAVIEAFGPASTLLTLSEVARRTGISPGSARRVLLTLQQLGYVGMHDQRFHLQPRALQLGYAYLSSLPLTGLAQPLLSQLTHEVDESCSIGLLDGNEIVFIARASARQLARDYMTVGMRYPAHATSVGKLLLAMLPPEEAKRRLSLSPRRALTARTITDERTLLRQFAAIRQRDWAFNDQETMVGLRSIAIPIRVDGTVTAGLTVSAPVTHHDESELVRKLLPPLRQAGDTLERMLAARSPAGALAGDNRAAIG